MADNNTYVIYISLPEDDSKSKVVSNQSGSQKSSENSNNGKLEKGLNMAKGLVSYKAVSAFVNNLISHEISMVSLRTGAVEYEEKLRFAHQTVNKLVGIGVATAIGATGGPIGALVGFIGSTMYTAIGYAQNMDRLRAQESLENISIGMAATRAGISGRRGVNQ